MLSRRAVIALPLALTACAPAAPPVLRSREAPVLPGLRLATDAPFDVWAEHLHRPTMEGTPTVLALSGGGEDGAFGAGVLHGWSERGDRPDFDVVTGVSTGALMAPFAFLGSGEDAELARI